MTPRIRFLLLPLATAFAGFGLAAPAGAQTAGEAPVADPCAAVFTDAARTNRNLQMATSAPPGSDARPGQEIRLEGAWNPAFWDGVSALGACVEVSDQVNPNLGGVEEPPANDGAFAHAFNIPAGLANGTVICTRLRLAGDPAGDATTGEWISKQACFEVHPEGAQTPPSTTPPPTSTPTTTPAPTTPTTAPAATPPPAAPPVTAPPAQTAGGTGEPEVPSAPAQSTVSFGTPDEPPAVEAESPRPSPRPSPRQPRPTPINLPILPETGASVGLLAAAGLTALACGLSMIAAGSRRSARR